MPGRRVELQPALSPVTAGATTMQEARFAVPTGRAKSALAFVNMLENSGGSGSIDFVFWSASDPNLDPLLATSSPFGHWCQATASLPSVTFAALGGKQTKAVALTVVGDQVRYSVAVGTGITCRFSIVVYFYDS